MEPLTFADLKSFERKRCADIKDVLSYLASKCIENLNTSLDAFFYSVSTRIYSEYALEFYGAVSENGSDRKMHRLPNNQADVCNGKNKVVKP